MFLPTNITLQFGDTGDFVAELQRRLSRLDLLGEMMVNASFDGNTVNAVKSFQSIHGLRVDGVAGPETLRRLAGILSGDSGSSSSTSGDTKQEEEKQYRRDISFYDSVMQDTAAQDPAPGSQLHEPALGPSRREAATAPTEYSLAASPPPRVDPALSPEAQRANAALINDILAQPAAEQLRERKEQPPADLRKDLEARHAVDQKRQFAEKLPEIETEKSTRTDEKTKRTEDPATPRNPLSAFVQKIVDYIESKLPRHVSQEVKEIGQTMLRAGVREAGNVQEIPTQAQEISAGRGAQAQAPQRS